MSNPHLTPQDIPNRLQFTTRLNPRVSNQAQSSSSVQPCKCKFPLTLTVSRLRLTVTPVDLSSPEPESLPKRAELEEVNEVKDSKSVDQQHKSRSATPFTWLQEAAESPAPQRQSETCAKGALCADLGHQHISDEEKASKRYWDLGELKLILRLRREIETGRGIAFYRDYLKRERAASEIDEAFASLAEVQTGSSTPIEGIEDHHGDLERALGSDMGLMSKIQTGSSTPIRFRKDHPGGLERALGSETWLNPEDETAPLGYTPDVSTCAGYLGDHAHGQPQDGAYGAPLGMLTGPQWRLHGNGYRGSMRRVGALDLLDELVQDPFAGLPIDKAEGCSRRNSLY